VITALDKCAAGTEENRNVITSRSFFFIAIAGESQSPNSKFCICAGSTSLADFTDLEKAYTWRFLSGLMPPLLRQREICLKLACIQ